MHERRERGFTLLELLVVLTVLAVATATAIIRLTAGTQNVDSAATALMTNLRLCRSQALATGLHYRVNVTGTTSYAVERLTLSGTNWVVDTTSPARTVLLPVTVGFPVGSGNYEFDTRGSIVGANTVRNVTLHDGGYNRDLVIQVWPSGQVNKG